MLPTAPLSLLLQLPPLLQGAVRHALAGRDGFREVTPADGAADVVVLAIESGGDLPRISAGQHGGAKAVLALLLVQDVALMDAAVLEGARGVVSLADTSDTLVKAIEKVHQGQLWIDRSATGRLFVQLARRQADASPNAEWQRIASLTQREREAIAALAADASASGKTLAARLRISDRTLRNHFTAIYDKLGVTNRVDLYAFAQRHQLVGTGSSGAPPRQPA